MNNMANCFIFKRSLSWYKFSLALRNQQTKNLCFSLTSFDPSKQFSTLCKKRRNVKLPVSSRSLSDFIIKGVHEPEYLDYLTPQIPFYKLINIQIKGYDYAVLESYGSYLHRLSNKLGLSVVKYWCSPNTSKKIETLKNESSVIESTYELNLYERNIQIENISAKSMSLLVEVVHRSLPTGVYLSIHEHNHELHEKSRYIPDLQLVEFKQELRMLQSNKKDDPEEDTKKKR